MVFPLCFGRHFLFHEITREQEWIYSWRLSKFALKHTTWCLLCDSLIIMGLSQLYWCQSTWKLFPPVLQAGNWECQSLSACIWPCLGHRQPWLVRSLGQVSKANVIFWEEESAGVNIKTSNSRIWLEMILLAWAELIGTFHASISLKGNFK